MCGKREMVEIQCCAQNVVNKYWFNETCAKMKSVFEHGKIFACERCVEAIEEIVTPREELPFYD